MGSLAEIVKCFSSEIATLPQRILLLAHVGAQALALEQ
jgi:hypothetical protein